MSSEVSLLLELNNPLYLFPIIGVVFTALLVYAFGFKSSTQPPDEVFDALNDRPNHKYKTHETIKKKKNNIKITTNRSESKSEPNGHINNGSVKALDKKPPKKSAVESKTISSVNNSNTNTKKEKKNKKNEELAEREDMDSGEWVQLVSKKERKNRKQKEEQMLSDSQELQNNKQNKSPKKESKKSSENKNQKNIDLDSKRVENVVKVETEKNEKNVAKIEIEANSEELLAEEPNDIYELAKEQRVPKKAQKHRNQKRSESEVQPKSETNPETEPKTNLNLNDKLTAQIVANYEASDHNKPDSLSTANNKKKKEKNNKKNKSIQPNSESNDKLIVKTDVKNNSIAVNETPVEKSENSVSAEDIPNEIKPSEEEEFKSVTKKRRARRE